MRRPMPPPDVVRTSGPKEMGFRRDIGRGFPVNHCKLTEFSQLVYNWAVHQPVTFQF